MDKLYMNAQIETLKGCEAPERCIFPLEDGGILVGFWKGRVAVVIPPEKVLLKAPENSRKTGWKMHARMKQKAEKLTPEYVLHEGKIYHQIRLDKRRLLFEDKFYKKLQGLFSARMELGFYDLGDGVTGFGMYGDIVGLCTADIVKELEEQEVA